MSPTPLTLRSYKIVIRLYPKRFRQEYGPDLVALVSDQLRDEPAWRVASRTAVDLALTVPTRHLEARMERPPLTRPRQITDHWWKLLLGGSGVLAALIAITAATGELSEDAWLLAMIAGLLAVVLMTTGMVLGVAHLAARSSRWSVPTAR